MRSLDKVGGDLLDELARILRDEKALADAIAKNEHAKVLELSIEVDRRMKRAKKRFDAFKKALER